VTPKRVTKCLSNYEDREREGEREREKEKKEEKEEEEKGGARRSLSSHTTSFDPSTRHTGRVD